MAVQTEDVVDQLRARSAIAPWRGRAEAELNEQAADTIERLREENARVTEALERLVTDVENAWGDPHTLAEARAALNQQ